jgi:hypothetical protein
MKTPMETVGEAAARGMVLRVECACGRTKYFIACDIVKVWGQNRRLDGAVSAASAVRRRG